MNQDSLNYLSDLLKGLQAGELQFHMMLPQQKQLNESFNKHFVLFQPKSFVGGDFYTVQRVGNKSVLALYDCTGHNVEGALVAIAIHTHISTTLNHTTDPGRIMISTHETLKQVFFGTATADMTIMVYNHKLNHVEYIGAMNPLYHYREPNLRVLKVDRVRVGDTNHTFDKDSILSSNIYPKKGDHIYLTTDGLQDQFGGENDKKFKRGNLKKTFFKASQKPIEDRKQYIQQVIKSWMGQAEQTDDICIIGLEF